MKYTSSTLMAGAASIIALLLIGSVSQAGTEVKATAKQSKAPLNNEPMPAAGAQSNLRCWQDGTLLFEEVLVNERSLSDAKQVLIFDQDKHAQKSREIFLFESGSATCLYKKA